MKEIILSQGLTAKVDDEDYEYLNQWKWCVCKYGKYGKYYYAVTNMKINKKYKTVLMHRFILSIPKGMDTDHIDHNGLNNQKYNLRNCTRSQNMMNRKSFGISKYLGVSYNSRKRIIAHICTNRKIDHLGTFETEIEAALAYDNAALEFHGEFANLNFK